MHGQHNEIPTHDLTYLEGREELFEVFRYDALTVINPVLEANFSPHRHNFYELMFMTGGRGEHVIDFRSYEINPPMLFFLAPGQIHYWDLSEPLEGYIFFFKEEFLVESGRSREEFNEFFLFNELQRVPFKPLEVEEMRVLEPIINDLWREVKADEFAKREALRSYFKILLIAIQRIIRDTSLDYEQTSLLRKFKRLISSRFSSKYDISGMAAQLGLSESHFRALIKNGTGRSPGEHIRHEITMEAKRLLYHTDLTVSEIAARLDFEDPSYFGRFFKRQAGMSPKSFRVEAVKRYTPS